MSVVLIVSRTQMANGVCVGAIDENSGELVRLHNDRGANLPADAPYQIGDRWNVNIQTSWHVRPRPHIEDKDTTFLSLINNVGINGIKQYINTHHLGNRLVSGDISNAFEGCLHFEGTKNYISRDRIPGFSTQFWITDRDLIHCVSFGRHYYICGNHRIKFVGFQECVERIPAGTIIRLSLANWWDGDGSGEDRCYLQLSGWYL